MAELLEPASTRRGKYSFPWTRDADAFSGYDRAIPTAAILMIHANAKHNLRRAKSEQALRISERDVHLMVAHSSIIM